MTEEAKGSRWDPERLVFTVHTAGIYKLPDGSLKRMDKGDTLEKPPRVEPVVDELEARVQELEGALRKAPQVHSYAMSGKREQADAVLKDMLSVL